MVIWKENVVKTKNEVESEIKRVTKMYKQFLDIPKINEDHAGEDDYIFLMQTLAKAKLDTLYWVTGKKRPLFRCDKGRLPISSHGGKSETRK